MLLFALVFVIIGLRLRLQCGLFCLNSELVGV